MKCPDCGEELKSYRHQMTCTGPAIKQWEQVEKDMPKMTDAQSIDKLWHLARQMPSSEDPDACPDCIQGKHMNCLYEEGERHDDKGCACEFCCGR